MTRSASPPLGSRFLRWLFTLPAFRPQVEGTGLEKRGRETKEFPCLVTLLGVWIGVVDGRSDEPTATSHADSATADSFEEFYVATQGRLFGVLARLLDGDVETAKDIAAEAFSRALEHWDRLVEMASPAGWTYQVAFNLLRRHARRGRLERAILRRERPQGPPTLPANELWDAVARLPARQRTAVLLHYVVDLPYDEVAAVMNVTLGTVGATLAAARQTLGVVLRDAESEDGNG